MIYWIEGGVRNGSPADEGRAGTLSPTHPHNGQSLEMTKYARSREMKNKKQKSTRKR